MKKAKRILVGLKTLDQAVELTDIACRLGAHRATLLLVHVIELPDATPLDAEVPNLEASGQEILRAAERVARYSKMKVQRLVLRARSAGGALLDELKQKKVELAVLGYHHGHTVGELILGTTHKHLMDHAPCALVMSVPPKDKKK